MEAEQHVTPGRLKKCMNNSFDVNLAPEGVSSPLSAFIFQFLALNTIKDLAKRRVEFSPY